MSKLRQIRSVIALVFLCFLPACAQTGLNGLNQYKRAEWGPEQGLSSGHIQALAQSPDGYLWVGTAEGLFRFDGSTFVPVLTDQKRPLRGVLGLTVDRDGILWVRAADTRIRTVQREGISSPVSHEGRILGIVTMAAGQANGIFATDTHKSVFRLVKDLVEPLPIHSKALLISIAEANDRRLWIGTDRGLLSWSGGLPRAEVGLGVDQKINCLLPDSEGHVWVGTDDGLAYWNGERVVPLALPNSNGEHLQVLTMMKDRDGNLWIGTSKGLLRYSAGGSVWVSTGSQDGGVPVTALMQDREGDIWFGTGAKLNRLESASIVSVKLIDASSRSRFGPVYVDEHGRIWFADARQGLFWIDHGVVHPVSEDGLSKDQTYSIDGSGENIWIGRRERGITRLRLNDGKIEAKTWTNHDGLAQNSVYVVRASTNSVWIGTLTAGVDRFENGRFMHFDEKNGLPSNDVSAIELGSQGQVWIGTSAGVCKIEETRCKSLQKSEMTDILSLFEEPARGLWVGTAKGLFLTSVRGERSVPLGTAANSRIQGIGLDQAGKLWLVSDRAVMSAMPTELLSSKKPSVRSYGSDDGLESSEGVQRSRSVVKDTEGQLWIATAHELAVVASRGNALPTVIPHVEMVSADGTTLALADAKAPPDAKRLTFAFTGLDLHAPSRVRFRYRLDNFDKTWSDATRDREATYTNLTPGDYVFRLIASNESNTWSAEESIVRVVVEPNVWQRWYVRGLLATVLLALVVIAYHLRTKFLLSQANILADERLRERTRIARDIHDTLLQGFISSLMHLHVAERQVPGDSPLKERFSFVLEGMERVIEEARLAVVGLRTPDTGHGDLESSLQDFFQEIGDLGSAHLSLRSSGRPRELNPEARENICAVAKEAILNAMRHAGANSIQVNVGWGWLRFRISVLDDGCGIDTTTLAYGRAQHWGLVGMKERAKQLKARLTITSRPSEGARVSLSVPAMVAYRTAKQSKGIFRRSVH